ncbi:hypothetical protein [Microbulbifer variabilis]|uniref:hypothetical protein n=1 Tax=Microbulbifer variabilis TaxID=266805 RepID=UPI001CFCC666|nr:hypothetical protein [Microbulbifer variabilis]
MEEVEIGLRDISINCLENSIRKYFMEEIKNISYKRRLINSFQYFGQGESDSIVINVRLKVGDSYTAYEDCDFAKLSIAGSTNVIEKTVLGIL